MNKSKNATRAIEMVVQHPMQKCLFLLEQLREYQQNGSKVEQTIVETQLHDAYHASFSIEQRLEVNNQVIGYLHLTGTLTEDENFETTTVIAQFLVPAKVDDRQEKWAILLALIFVAVMSLTMPMHIFYKLSIIALTVVIGAVWWAYEYSSAHDLRPHMLVQRIERTLKKGILP